MAVPVAREIFETAWELYRVLAPGDRIRLLGVRVEGLTDDDQAPEQLVLDLSTELAAGAGGRRLSPRDGFSRRPSGFLREVTSEVTTSCRPSHPWLSPSPQPPH